MKQQLQIGNYQQAYTKKKVDTFQELNNIKGNGLYLQHQNSSNLEMFEINKIPQSTKYQNMLSNQPQQQRGLKNGQTINNQANQDIFQNNQSRFIQDNLSQMRCSTQPTSSPIQQTASKSKQSRSPSYKIGSQIKLQSQQMDNIQRQFNILMEKENKYLASNSSHNSGNKSSLQQQREQQTQLSVGGSYSYLNPTKSSSNNRRQRNLTQLRINVNPSNNSINRSNGSAKSLIKANRSLTPNSRNNSYSSNIAKRSINQNFLQISSGNQTTANISQKHYDFSTKQDPLQGSKYISKSTKTVNQPHCQQQISQNSIIQNIQQSTQNINGEAINNKLITVIQKNPQNVEEYSIKDKQLNKLLQQLLQQRMQQQQQLQQPEQQNDQNVQISVQGSKYLENSASPTMSLMSSKPSTLQSYYAHLSLNNTSKQFGSQFQSNYNNQNSAFMNSSQYGQVQKFDYDIQKNNLSNNYPIISNIYKNQPSSNILNDNSQQFQIQIQQQNTQDNNIFQKQLQIEDQFQQRYQQYKEKFQSYQTETYNNAKLNQKENKKYSKENLNQIGSVEVPFNISQNYQNQLDLIYENHKHNDLKNQQQENFYNSNKDNYQLSPDSIVNYNNNRKQLLLPDENIILQNQNNNHQNNSVEQSIVPMTINTETDSIQLMSTGERENMIKYIQGAQFPDYTNPNYQEIIKDIPNEIHKEIIILYEQKIKEITEKFEHRDIILRQSLMKLEKENSILLSRVKEQSEEVQRYKTLREMEVKLIKKLENEVKQEKTKYQKLFKQKIVKKGSDKGLNNQIVEELNKKINELYSEKECLEYLLKDALLKTELFKAKESIIYKQAPFSNNLNTSTSTLSAGNQTANNFNQLNQNPINSNSIQSYQNYPIQTENINLLSLDNSLNQTHSQQQQVQQQQDQLHQKYQLIQNKQSQSSHSQQKQEQKCIQQQNLNQFQEQKQTQQQLQLQLLQNQEQQQINEQMNMFQNNIKNPLESSQENNFLRIRNKSHDNHQFEQNKQGNIEIGKISSDINIQSYNQHYLQGFEQNIHEQEQEIVQNEQNNQHPQQIHLFRKEYEDQNSERNNYMKTYQATTQGVNQSIDNSENNHSNLSNYVLRKSNSNQNNDININKQFSNQDNEFGVEQCVGTYSMRSSLQKQQNQTQYKQRLVYQNEKNQQQNKLYDNIQRLNQQLNINLLNSDNNNLQNYDFTNITNQNNSLVQQQPYPDIRNYLQLQGVDPINEIRSTSNSNRNINNNFKNNFYDILICDNNSKYQSKPIFLNNSQVIAEEGSSAGNTTKNNNNYNTCNNSSSIKNKISSTNNFDSNAVEENNNINQYNDIFFIKEEQQDCKNTKIFVQNNNFSKSNNIDQDEEIEAEFKDISESNRRGQQAHQQIDKNEIQNQQQQSVEVNQQTHEVLSLTEEYLKNKVEILNSNDLNYIFNLQKVTSQSLSKETQEQIQKYEEDETIMNYYNTKNMYLQKYYASQNATSSNNGMSKSLNSSHTTSEKYDKLNMSLSTK